MGLGPGDYATNSMGVEELKALSPGRVRVFIGLAGDPNEPVFDAEPRALINAEIPGGLAPKGCSLEIWYSGSGTIKLEQDSTFNGIIYAPNARIEIGPAQATFRGAMVARDIIVSGDSRIYCDPELAHWHEQ